MPKELVALRKEVAGLHPSMGLYQDMAATWRSTIGRGRDWMCVCCQTWVAEFMGLIQRPKRAEVT
jgi:hypothetical protein